MQQQGEEHSLLNLVGGRFKIISVIPIDSIFLNYCYMWDRNKVVNGLSFNLKKFLLRKENK